MKQFSCKTENLRNLQKLWSLNKMCPTVTEFDSWFTSSLLIMPCSLVESQSCCCQSGKSMHKICVRCVCIGLEKPCWSLVIQGGVTPVLSVLPATVVKAGQVNCSVVTLPLGENKIVWPWVGHYAILWPCFSLMCSCLSVLIISKLAIFIWWSFIVIF